MPSSKVLVEIARVITSKRAMPIGYTAEDTKPQKTPFTSPLSTVRSALRLFAAFVAFLSLACAFTPPRSFPRVLGGLGTAVVSQFL